MENLILIGGGNQAHYTIDIIESLGKYNIVGIIDSIHPINSIRFGYRVIGRQENIKTLIEEYKIEGGVISIGDNWSRYKVYRDIISSNPYFKFPNIIHPSTIISKTAKLGVGIVAMAGVIINPLAIIGDFTFLATGAQIEHDCSLKRFSSVSAGSILGGHVVIGEFSAITLGVTIIDRLTIGKNTVVGSGSLITKPLPDNVLAYGNPAKIIRSREEGEKFLK
jgi:sugar O-acyltransferase (sialic acid O-acetyltransferase NeuD family)